VIKNLLGLTLQTDLPLLLLQQLPTVKVNPSKKLIYSPGPSTSISKEETHSSSPEDIRPLPKARPRKSQNVNKKKKETAILTDPSFKNALKKTTAHVLEQMRKTGPKKRGKRSMCNIYSERYTKETPKKHKEIEECKRCKRKSLQGYFMPVLLDTYSRSAFREMWIQCTVWKLWACEKYADGSPTFIFSSCQFDWIGIRCLKINAVSCMLLLRCVSFAPNFPFQFK